MIQRRDYGFTIVELMLAMVFIALLLLAIAGTVMQIATMYNKGLTIKSVNQAGGRIIADMKRSIGQSAVFDARPGHGNYIQVTEGGRLCTGAYTYVWNYGEFIKNGNAIYKYDDNVTRPRFTRLNDPGGRYCSDSLLSALIPRANSVELLSVSDNDLAVQSFYITQLTENNASGMALYDIKINISTGDQDDISGLSCKAPGSTNARSDFCAVSQFDFIARTGDTGGSK